MAMSISELQRIFDAPGVGLPDPPHGPGLPTLPVLREAAKAVDGSPVYAGEVDGTEAFRLWSHLRGLHDRTGWWPVLAGEPDALDRVLVGLDRGFAPAHSGADGMPPDGRALLDGWAREAVRFLPAPASDSDAASAGPDVPRVLRRLTEHVADEVDLDHVGGLHVSALGQERTVLCLVQAPSGSDVPTLLNWLGACNYDITGPEHSAVLRHFDLRYGAELVTLETAVMEVLVTRRPRTPETVATAAVEQYAYCNDIVHQGVGTIEELINGQLRSGTWYFWWD
ncbi:DUF4253 domain-containing protein [Streptomycetaceae bacterium NBC_01309]